MITLLDRTLYPNYADSSILGIKLIGGLENKAILSIIKMKFKSDSFKAIMTLMGGKTNPNWIMGQVASEAYDRDIIDEDGIDAINKVYGNG